MQDSGKNEDQQLRFKRLTRLRCAPVLDLLLIFISSLASVSCGIKNKFMGKETVPITKSTPTSGSTDSDVIPPVPVTGSYLAGVMFKPGATVAADSTLDIVDPAAMTILRTSATNPQGEFSIPVSVITKAVINVRVKEGGAFYFLRCQAAA